MVFEENEKIETTPRKKPTKRGRGAQNSEKRKKSSSEYQVFQQIMAGMELGKRKRIPKKMLSSQL